MINTILLNYNFKIIKIYKGYSDNYFFINNERIFIKKITNEKIDSLLKIIEELYRRNIKVDTFLLNKNNSYFFTYKNDKYILYKENRYVEKITLDELKSFWDVHSNLDSFDIINNWKIEIDYIEKNMTEYNKEYEIIKNSINYFIGMAENSIELLNLYKHIIISKNDSIGHKHFTNLDASYLDNPFSFIKTNKMYDVALFFKYSFFNNNVNYNELDMIINNNDEYENAFLFSCLLYPDYYFEMLKNILSSKEDESSINCYILKIKTYKKFLQYCQMEIKNNNIIKNLNWIKH